MLIQKRTFCKFQNFVDTVHITLKINNDTLVVGLLIVMGNIKSSTEISNVTMKS